MAVRVCSPWVCLPPSRLLQSIKQTQTSSDDINKDGQCVSSLHCTQRNPKISHNECFHVAHHYIMERLCSCLCQMCILVPHIENCSVHVKAATGTTCMSVKYEKTDETKNKLQANDRVSCSACVLWGIYYCWCMQKSRSNWHSKACQQRNTVTAGGGLQLVFENTSFKDQRNGAHHE